MHAKDEIRMKSEEKKQSTHRNMCVDHRIREDDNV